MEPNVNTATSAVIAPERIIRREFLPPYANPPISNYRKFWYSSSAAFWAAFGVRPGDGSVVNQLGTKPVTSLQKAFQDVGFGYTFKAAATTDYWFDVEVAVGPTTANGSKNTIELELWGSDASPVVVSVTSRYQNVNATLDAQLTAGQQYTLIFKSKVEIAVGPGESRYGEVIASFKKLVVNYIRPWGIEPLAAESVESEDVDLEHTLKALQAGANGAEVLLQPVSYQDIARAGSAGFGGFSE
jgi:hypothetical protein